MVTKQAKVTSKGQVAIPAKVREALRLREGDLVSFEVDSQGKASRSSGWQPLRTVCRGAARGLRPRRAAYCRRPP